MSQEKVDRYKKEKANRKKILKREKAKSIAVRTAGTLVCVALIGYSGYSRWESSRPAKSTEITMDALSDYLNTLTADDTAE